MDLICGDTKPAVFALKSPTMKALISVTVRAHGTTMGGVITFPYPERIFPRIATGGQ